MKTLIWMAGVAIGFLAVKKVQQKRGAIAPEAAHGVYGMEGEDGRFFVDGRKTDIPYPTVVAWCSYCQKYQGVYLNPRRDRTPRFPGENVPRFLMHEHGQCYGSGQSVDIEQIIKDFT